MKEIFALLAVILFTFGIYEFNLIATTQFKELFLAFAGAFMLIGVYAFAEAIYEVISHHSKDPHDRAE